MRGRILSAMGLSFMTIMIGRTALMTNQASAFAETKTEQAAENHTNDKHEADNGAEGQHEVGHEEDPGAPNKESMNLQLDPPVCLTSEIAELLETRRDEIDGRESDLVEREAALAALETKLGERLSEIETANAALKGNVTLLQNTASQDILHLVEMYQSMKPKQAADIFNSMDPSFAAGFLREMNGQQAGMIMANMDARKSYAISIIIAGRNAKYRKTKT